MHLGDVVCLVKSVDKGLPVHRNLRPIPSDMTEFGEGVITEIIGQATEIFGQPHLWFFLVVDENETVPGIQRHRRRSEERRGGKEWVR